MTLAEVMRTIAFVLVVLNLSILTAMARAYVRLMREDEISRVGVPRSMLLFTGGFALILLAIFIRSVQLFSTPFTPTSLLSNTGMLLAFLGLLKLKNNITDRERYRRSQTTLRLSQAQHREQGT